MKRAYIDDCSLIELLDEVPCIEDGLDFSFESPLKRPRLLLPAPGQAITEGVTELIRPGYGIYRGLVIIVTPRFDRDARLRHNLPIDTVTKLAVLSAPAETYTCRYPPPMLTTWLARLMVELHAPSVVSPLFVALHWLCRPTWPKVPLVIPASLRGRAAHRGEWGYSNAQPVAQFSLEVTNVFVTRLHVDMQVHLSAGLRDVIDLDATDEEAEYCPLTSPMLGDDDDAMPFLALRQVMPVDLSQVFVVASGPS